VKRFALARRARLWVAVALLASVVALAGGCGPIAATIDTESALRDAGYQSVSVNFSVGNTDEVRVSVTVSAEPALSHADDVAHIVWDKFHERFSLLAVTVHGSGPTVTRDYSYSDLVSLFGPRNPAYDRTSLTSATTRLGVIVIIVVIVLIAAVIVTVVLVTRRRRRRPPPWPPGPPGAPWMQGGPPPPGAPPVWQGAPPPPGPGGPPAWPGGQQAPAQPGTQPPASYPMWPPPQGPPPGQQGPGSSEGGSRPEPAPTWPPAPSPPASDD
jgi:hypothetical protein